VSDKQIIIHNPNKLKTIDFNKFHEFQGDLKYDLSETELNKLKNSIIKLGIFVPKFVWVNEDRHYIMDGHQTKIALQSLKDDGYTIPEIPYVMIEASNEKDAAEKLFQINSRYAKINPQSVWLETLEFTPIEITSLLASVEIPEFNPITIDEDIDIDLSDEELNDDGSDSIPKTSIVNFGDTYILGKHKVVCGDSTDSGTLHKLFGNERAVIGITSPPYNCGSIGQVDSDKKVKTGKKYINGDDQQSDEEYLKFLIDSLNGTLDYCDTSFFNIQMLAANKVTVIQFSNHFAQYYKDTIYWIKKNPAPSLKPNTMNSSVELVLAYSRLNPTKNFESASFSQGTYYNVIEGPKNIGNKWHEIHKAAFPMYLPLNIIKNFSHKDDIILDIFGGTGTSLIASEKLQRICYTIDLEPIYCETMIERWQEETGLEAVRLSDGLTFNEVKNS